MKRCTKCELTVDFVPLLVGEDPPDCHICGDRPDRRLRWSDGTEGATICEWCWRWYLVAHENHDG